MSVVIKYAAHIQDFSGSRLRCSTVPAVTDVIDFLADSVAAHLTGADPPVMVPLPVAR